MNVKVPYAKLTRQVRTNIEKISIANKPLYIRDGAGILIMM